MKAIRLFLLAIAIQFAAQAFGQTNIDDIDIILPDINNAQDRAMLEGRAKELVGQMNDYISNMVDKNETSANRWRFRKDCLGLFIGEGEPLTFNGVQRDGVKMEVTSVKYGNTVKNTRLMKVYFTNLINLLEKGTYTSITITSTEVPQMEVSTLKKVSEGIYQCTVTFTQNFLGKRGERGGYGDTTKKSVTVYFVMEETIIGQELIPRLGDVAAGESHRTL